MAKERVRDYDNSTVNDGSHAIRRFTVGDFLIMLILVILCLTCILPFIHLAAKSVSSNTAVMQRAVVLWPIGINFDAYSSIFQDGTLVRSFLYSVMVVAIFTLLGMITCQILDMTVGQSKVEIFGESIKMLDNPTVGLDTALGATIVLVVAGTIAGIFPAMKAAKVKPIEALRAE